MGFHRLKLELNDSSTIEQPRQLARYLEAVLKELSYRQPAGVLHSVLLL